jgi:hypothetical protein
MRLNIKDKYRRIYIGNYKNSLLVEFKNSKWKIRHTYPDAGGYKTVTYEIKHHWERKNSITLQKDAYEDSNGQAMRIDYYFREGESGHGPRLVRVVFFPSGKIRQVRYYSIDSQTHGYSQTPHAHNQVEYPDDDSNNISISQIEKDIKQDIIDYVLSKPDENENKFIGLDDDPLPEGWEEQYDIY